VGDLSYQGTEIMQHLLPESKIPTEKPEKSVKVKGYIKNRGDFSVSNLHLVEGEKVC
jgi:hypothetical protein